jgi:hypothetical protein
VILFSCKDTDHNPQGGGVIFACLYGAPSWVDLDDLPRTTKTLF